MVRLLPPTLLLSLLLGTCAPAQKDLRNYYFPVRELAKEGQVYAYRQSGTLPGPAYDHTYYLGVNQDTALYLSVTRYSATNEPVQQSRQRIKNDGAYLEAMTLAQADTSGRAVLTPTEIKFPKVFPFYHDAAVPQAAGFRIALTPPAQSETRQFVSLNRTFGGDTTVTVMGTTYDAIYFDVAGEVSVRDPENGDISPQFTGREIYAKGLGLVAYRRDLGAAGTVIGELTKLIPMQKFAERGDPHAGHDH